MASTPLSQATARWQRIAQQLTQSGIKPSVWQPIYAADIKKVQGGTSGMTDQEIQGAIGTLISGKPQVNPESKGESGFFAPITNALHDIQEIPTAFVGGAINYAATLPEQVADVGKLLTHDQKTQEKYGLEDPYHQGSFFGGLGALVRDISKVPVLGPLIPGAKTAGALTTEKGREELAQHPVYTALDVAPVVSEAGRLGAFGKGAAETSALGALQEGKPWRAAGRTAYDVPTTVLGKVTDALGKEAAIPNRARAGELLMQHWAIGPVGKAIGTTLGIQERVRDHLMTQFQKNHPVLEEFARLPEAQQEAVTRALEHYKPSAVPEAQRPMMDALRAVQDEITVKALGGENLVAVPDYLSGKGSELYPADSPVVTEHNRLEQRTKNYLESTKIAEQAKQALSKQPLNEELQATYRAVEVKSQGAADAAARSLARIQKIMRGEGVRTGMQRARGEVPARFQPLINEQFRAKVLSDPSVIAKASTTQGAEMVRAVAERTDKEFFQELVGKKQADAYWKDSMAAWPALKAAGYDPMFVSNIPESAVNQLGFPIIPKTGGVSTPRQFRRAAGGLDRSIHNVAFSLTGQEAEVLTQKAMQALVDTHLQPKLPNGDIHPDSPIQTFDKIEAPYRDLARKLKDNGAKSYQGIKITPGIDVSALARRLMEQEWQKWDPESGFSTYIRNPSSSQLMVPIGYAKALRMLGGDDGLKFFQNHPIPGTRLFKRAVLMGPRHMAHIEFGGLMMLAGREPGGLLHFLEAHRQIKNGFIPEVMNNVHSWSPDQWVQHAAGGTMGRIVKQLGRPFEFMTKVEENTVNLYKVASAINHLDGRTDLLRGDRPFTLAETALRDEAFTAANKVAVSLDGMHPIERQIMRTGMLPFFAFTRHLMRYVFTYPVDHPLRAAFISHVAAQQEEAFTDTLPRTFMNLFFIGEPDAQGNIAAVDYKNVNPFRSMYSDFTAAGIISQLNPAFQAILKQAGVNPLSDTPDLHPDLKVDPQTGQLVLDRDAKSEVFGALSTYIPEAGALDAVLNVTGNLKSLKASDKSAYWRAVANMLNIPFVESTYNLPQSKAKLETKRYQQAQKDLKSYLDTGDFSQISHYNQIPVPSYLKPFVANAPYATPAQLRAIWEALSRRYGGVNPRQFLPSG